MGVKSSGNNERASEFNSLVAEFAPLISKICYMYSTDSEHFKDLYQESLINIWQGMDSFRGEARISSWIYRITLNSCVSHFRRNRRYDGALPLDAVIDMPDDDDSRADDVKMLYSLISRLNKLDKAIVMLWLDEKSYDEISDITGISKSNVGVRLSRIRQRLAQMSRD